MKVTTVSANVRFSKDTGQGAWKVIELGAEETVDGNEGWQTTQAHLYQELGRQMKALWANGNGQGQKADEAPTTTTEASHQSEPPPARAHYCQQHGTEFKRFGKDGRVWYSHKGPDGKWCKEK